MEYLTEIFLNSLKGSENYDRNMETLQFMGCFTICSKTKNQIFTLSCCFAKVSCSWWWGCTVATVYEQLFLLGSLYAQVILPLKCYLVHFRIWPDSCSSWNFRNFPDSFLGRPLYLVSWAFIPSLFFYAILSRALFCSMCHEICPYFHNCEALKPEWLKCHLLGQVNICQSR